MIHFLLLNILGIWSNFTIHDNTGSDDARRRTDDQWSTAVQQLNAAILLLLLLQLITAAESGKYLGIGLTLNGVKESDE